MVAPIGPLTPLVEAPAAPRRRRTYSAALKDEFARRLAAGESRRAVSNDLGIDMALTYGWVPVDKSAPRAARRDDGKYGEARAALFAAIAAGEPSRDAIRRLGIRPSTAADWLSGRRRGYEAIPAEAPAAVESDWIGPEPTTKILSEKSRLLAGLARLNGKASGVPDLTHYVSIEPHDLTHLLWALNKQGYVKFRESKRATTGSAQSNLHDIRLTARGWVAAGHTTGPGHEVGQPVHLEPVPHPSDRTDFRTHGQTAAPVGEIVRSRLPAPPPTPAIPEVALPAPVATPSWPELTRLQARVAEADRATSQAAALEAAAAALGTGDPLAEQLLDRAAALLLAADLTPTEREYLAYAEAHR